MRPIMSALIVLVVGFALVGLAVAQQSERPPSQPGAPGAFGHEGDHMKHMQLMQMCRQMMGGDGMMGGMRGGMMGGGMGGGMMGMMPTTGDPKRDAEMMAMRGEMLKAMGEIMMKYAKQIQSEK